MESGTVLGRLAAQVQSQPQASFLVHEDENGLITNLTYGETWTTVVAVSEVLRINGVRRGDRVMLQLGNSVEFVTTLLATGFLGAVAVPTNPSAAPTEVAHFLRHSGATLTVAETDRVELVKQAAARAGLNAHSTLSAWSVALRAVTPGAFGPAELPMASTNPLDPFAILYTSGTTSRPKGVVLTNRNYVRVGDAVAEHLGMQRDDRWLITLPMYHANAQYYCLMSAICSGASTAVMSRFSASAWGRQAARHRATLASLFAAPMRMILAKPPVSTDACDQLRTTIFAQNLAEDQLASFERRFDTQLLQLYGMTETVVPYLMNPSAPPRQNMTAGRPVAGAEVRLVDSSGNESEIGELEIRGVPGVDFMLGYLDDPAATAETISGGWLRTGDRFERTPEGWYRFRGRAGDLIKSAGENISATEVEEVLQRHPAVQEAAVLGLPDPIRDEVVGAAVILRPGLAVEGEEISAWAEDHLAPHKLPARVEIVSEFPRTGVGKVQKHLLRSVFTDHAVPRTPPRVSVAGAQ